jgi:hypothetical protein
MIGRGNRSTRRKPAPVPLCPPQTPHATRTGTRATAVGSQRLTAKLRHGRFTFHYCMTYQIDQEFLTFAQEMLGRISVRVQAIMNKILHGFLQSFEGMTNVFFHTYLRSLVIYVLSEAQTTGKVR